MSKLLSSATATRLVFPAPPTVLPTFPVSAYEMERNLLVWMGETELPKFTIDGTRT